ncbi:vacuolar protein sorting-associated protein 36-like [Dorcoceras hygrometricum]|uniref:Vacuolar protein-sorting-associated protein 36 n=1 Tax=Dorcoceras hygrometricum TaxID=472368 RepID=A0A2Z7DAM5_9LAMI|nr:vacuolar protein sorting-associated protein 36-like [Dorcoceras hygrometricum]
MAGNFLPEAKLTANGRPVLDAGEVECSLLSVVDVLSEDLASFPHLKSCLLILTTHRLLFLPQESNSSANSGSHYVPLSAIQQILSAKKSLKSMFHSPRIRFQVGATPDGRISENGAQHAVFTLVLRGKTDPDSFLGKFWDAWRGKAWEASGSTSGSVLGKGSGESSLAIRMPVVGVAGILRKEQEKWENTDKSLQDAFQDLNALMSKAKEMVLLAEKMRSKLLSGSNNQTGGVGDDELGSKEEMQDWLLSVGIASPVTKESAGALYHQQLSRQLADFVKKPLERAGGMMNLIDIYCLFNRARGTELISPDDLLQACSLWEKFDVYVRFRANLNSATSLIVFEKIKIFNPFFILYSPVISLVLIF